MSKGKSHSPFSGSLIYWQFLRISSCVEHFDVWKWQRWCLPRRTSLRDFATCHCLCFRRMDDTVMFSVRWQYRGVELESVMKRIFFLLLDYKEGKPENMSLFLEKWRITPTLQLSMRTAESHYEHYLKYFKNNCYPPSCCYQKNLTLDAFIHGGFPDFL